MKELIVISFRNPYVAVDSYFIPVIRSILRALNPANRKSYSSYPPLRYIMLRIKQFIKGSTQKKPVKTWQ